MNKKAAMFGLDARIALAIFAALSVITGAALYGAIQKARIVALQQEFVEIEKAIEAYILDVGWDMPITTDSSAPIYLATMLDVDELFESSSDGWRGPYLQSRKDTSTADDYYRSWPTQVNSASNLMIRDITASLAECDGSETCFYVIEIDGIPIDIAKQFDAFIDGAYDADKGKVRIIPQGADNGYIFYRSIPFSEK